MEGSSAMRTNSMRISDVARLLSQTFSVLCFDEFQITDICDALLIKQLFEEIFRFLKET